MFEEGQRVLCFHGPLLYEAKVLTRELLRKKKYQYFIHYVGWNKSWDEWVMEDRLIECNETNLKEQQRLNIEHAKTRRSSRRRARRKLEFSENLKPIEIIEIDDDDSCTEINGKNNNNDFELSMKIKKEPKDIVSEDEELIVNSEAMEPQNFKSENKEFRSKSIGMESCNSSAGRKNWKKLITIEIPDMMKCCLHEDWREVKCEKILHKIPTKPTVHEIVKKYINHKNINGNSIDDNSTILDIEKNHLPYKDLSNGIIRYFDMVLGTKLLYENEKEQYTNILKEYPLMPVSHLYGGIHLLRLFVKIGPILETLGVNYSTMNVVVTSIDDFVKFLDENWEEYFPIRENTKEVTEEIE